MPRTIPAAISSAIASAGAQPSTGLTSTDLQRRLATLTSTGFPSGRSKTLLTSGGSILRSANIGSTLSIYRIPTPSSASNWTAAAVATQTAQLAAGSALVQTGTTIRCFYINAANNLCYRQSANDGASWAVEVVAAGPELAGDTCTGIAAATTTDVYSAWYTFAQAASGLWRIQFSGGVWGAYASVGPTSPVWGQIRGLDIDASLSTYVFTAGVQTRAQQSGLAGCSTTFNGSVWTPWVTIHPMDTPTNGLSNAYPTVNYNPADTQFYAGINLQDDGSVSGTARNRLSIWKSPDGATWQRVQTVGNSVTLESHIIWLANALYLFDNQTVYQAPAPLAPTDLTSDVLSIVITEKESEATTFTVVLANQNGQYTSIPNLVDNARLQLSLGYNGTTIVTHYAYIDALEFSATPESQLLTIHCRDILKFLDQVNTTFLPYSNQTVAQLATAICQQAGVALSTLPTTSQFAEVIPCFIIVPGETWLAALKRLGNVYDFEITATAAPSVKITERSALDASSWTYGQEHLGLAWQRSSDQPNIVRVVGGSTSTSATYVFAEAVDNANLLNSGAHRYRHIVDRLVDTSAKAQLKANLALRDDQTQSQTGAITVTLNPRHELLDVIQITEPRAGLAALNARISEIQTHVDWQHGSWFQHLTLELP